MNTGRLPTRSSSFDEPGARWKFGTTGVLIALAGGGLYVRRQLVR